MFTFLKGVLGNLLSGRDDERRHATGAQDTARMLEMDEPMADGGGQLAGEHIKSETEEALQRAVSRERQTTYAVDSFASAQEPCCTCVVPPFSGPPARS